MKRKSLVSASLLLLCCGCSTMSNTEAGAVTGGALGAGVGALAGAAVRAPVAGALIGGAVGALAGGAAGNAEDRREDRAIRQAAAAQAAAVPPPPTPSPEEVANMVRSGLGDTVVINAIRQSPGPYVLASNQIVWLKQQGVSDVVISEMQAHGPQQVVYPGPRPVIIYEQPPPVRFGFGYSYGRRCW